jgi:3-phosphoshikimate 1-carboxyvinyltransferase
MRGGRRAVSDRAELVRMRGGTALRGRARVPVDLDVAQRALLFAALGSGRSQLHGLLEADSFTSALHAWRALGVQCSAAPDSVSVEGVGLHGLRMPSAALDCGRSFAALALLTGTLSGQQFGTRLTVHPTLAQRSVEHIVGPLKARGAHVAGRTQGERSLAPIAVAPLIESEQLLGLDAALPFSDPEAKSAVLISGLYAAGPTTISEPTVSADHTERLFVALGLPLRRIGSVVAFDPTGWDRRVPALGEIALPGSATLAAYLAVIAQSLPGSDITLLNVGLNPSRNGVLDILGMWGAGLAIMPRGDAALREPIADVRVRGATLRGGVIDGELLVRARDELPALALLGASARRGVQICDLAWFGAEADPEWSQLDALFAQFGLLVERSAGELRVGVGADDSRANLRGAHVDVQHDPRLSLAACALGLASPGETVVEHAAQALRAVYPGFIETAQALGADIEFA